MTKSNAKSAAVWVLLRGLGREAGHWGPFLNSFQARFVNDEVLAIDLPGAGDFYQQRSPASIAEIMNFVRAKVIERSSSSAPLRLVAMSLGAMVAMEWMRARPEDLEGCVLINTSSRDSSPFYDRLRWQIWPDFLKALGQTSAREREAQVVQLLINRPEAREKALPLWIKLANERPISYLNFSLQLLAAARFNGLQEKPKAPTLLLHSLGDRLVDPACTIRLEKKWGWPRVQHAWGGHDLTWDDPNWVLDQIEVFQQSLLIHS